MDKTRGREIAGEIQLKPDGVTEVTEELYQMCHFSQMRLAVGITSVWVDLTDHHLGRCCNPPLP